MPQSGVYQDQGDLSSGPIITSLILMSSNPMSRPCGVFNMNRANFVSIGGIILTYMIVLLQFRLGAEDDYRGLHFNIEDMPGLLCNRTIEDFLSFADNPNATLADWHFMCQNKTYANSSYS